MRLLPKLYPHNRSQLLILQLIGFLMFNSLGVAYILSLLQQQTIWYYTRFFLDSPTHDRSDSWHIMYQALDYVRQHPGLSLYTEIFFKRHVKFQYPPSSLLFIMPLSRLKVYNVVLVANLLSWIAILFTIPLIAHLFIVRLRQTSVAEQVSIGERYLFLAIIAGFSLTFYPVMRSFQIGQLQTWIYVCFVLALHAWVIGKTELAGGWIGIICLMKPQLGLFLPWGIVRKQWRFVIGMLATVGVLGGISIALFGLHNYLDYLRVLVFIDKHGESYYQNHSVNGLLHHLLSHSTNLYWTPDKFAPYNFWVYLGTLLTSLLLISTALFVPFKRHHPENVTDFLIAALSFTIAAPIVWEHHYSLLLPMFVVTLPAILASQHKHSNILLLSISFILTSHYYYLLTLRVAYTHWNFLEPYLLFGAILFLIHLYWLQRNEKGML